MLRKKNGVGTKPCFMAGCLSNKGLLYIQNYSNAGQKSAEGRFLSKWVYKFRPAKILCTYQDIHIWGGQQQKKGAKSSKPFGNFFCRLGNFFCRLGNFFGSDQFLPSNELSNITYGVVNFPKTCTKSSKPQSNFFWRLAVLFLAASWTFFVPSKNSIKNLSFCFQTSHMGQSTSQK